MLFKNYFINIDDSKHQQKSRKSGQGVGEQMSYCVPVMFGVISVLLLLGSISKCVADQSGENPQNQIAAKAFTEIAREKPDLGYMLLTGYLPDYAKEAIREGLGESNK